MNFLEIDVADHVKVLSTETLRSLQLDGEGRTLFSTTNGLSIVGVHILPPVGMKYPNLLGGQAIGLGQSYQVWFDENANSKPAAMATKRVLAKQGLSLDRFGAEVLATGYVHGPHEHEFSTHSPPKISFPVPKEAVKIAKKTIASMENYLYEFLGPEHTSESLKFDYIDSLLKNNLMIFGFGLEEEPSAEAFYLSNPQMLEAANSGMHISLARINSAIEAADNNPAEWARICQDAADYGSDVQWPYFSSRFDNQVVEQVIFGRLTLLTRLRIPHFHARLFFRQVSAGNSSPSLVDDLKWILRAKPDLLSKADSILKEYKSTVESHHPWCGVDHFKDVVPAAVPSWLKCDQTPFRWGRI